MKQMSKRSWASSLIIAFFALLWTRRQAAAVGNASSWCVARGDADVGSLQSALQWVCGIDSEFCKGIQQTGEPCSPFNNATDLVERASFAFHYYYIKNDMASESCNFENNANVTSQEPNYPGCKFPSYSDGNIINGAPGPNPDVSYSDSIRYGRWVVSMALLFTTLLIQFSDGS
ncbi:unnamed protein product [Cuscuta europaea]|uniref:X8 domain-containing protein n=1 Tax=Cuscuta europaea TaxID=41803 RepID=A0A9P0Z6X7_CUSEU|nr:unnamed protein product [Cuscuta europaea]